MVDQQNTFHLDSIVNLTRPATKSTVSVVGLQKQKEKRKKQKKKAKRKKRGKIDTHKRVRFP